MVNTSCFAVDILASSPRHYSVFWAPMHEDEDDPFEVEFEGDDFDPESTLSMVQVRTKSKSCITKLQATPINKVLMALRCTWTAPES